ncbi:MAG TPA: prepilin peptidase [Candidatus Nanoarchaeia archaeon]|nr:prepilin peptidase [Candidatus Nanoarchaeia archaeon]
MIEYFLIVLGLLWVGFASIQDLRKREVANWISFSLIVFALGIRIFYGIFTGEWSFLFQGIFGLIVFFILGNALYYGRMFAGGDAKLMISLGAILPITTTFGNNLKIFFSFFLLFLFAGALYGLAATARMSLINFKEFKKDFISSIKKNKKKMWVIMIAGLITMVLGLQNGMFFSLGVLIFVFPYIYYYALSVDRKCMVRKVKAKYLTEGDWLAEKLKIGKKTIDPNWEGLSMQEIRLIRKHYKEIKVKYGIPFVPVFFIALVAFIYVWFSGLWNAFW